MSSFKSVVGIGAAALALAAAPIAFSSAARADACDRLWYKRNSIYADAGYCFQTARASGLRRPLLFALRSIEPRRAAAGQ